jgi:hypothetical protein
MVRYLILPSIGSRKPTTGCIRKLLSADTPYPMSRQL